MNKLRAAFGNKCQHCGATENLHFDHIDPTTKLNAIGNLAIRKGFSYCLEEAKKCQLLCKECHQVKSISQGDYTTNAKHHVITWNDGRVETVYSLDTWAKEHGYNSSHLRAIRNGKRKSHKGIVSVFTV